MPLAQITAVMILHQVLVQCPSVVEPLLLAELTGRMTEEAPAGIAFIPVPCQISSGVQSLLPQKGFFMLHAYVAHKSLVCLLQVLAEAR